MTEASVRRIHNPVYNDAKYPPLPPRIRLSANCWERVWWLTLVDPVKKPDLLQTVIKRFASEKIVIRAQMRTQRRICFAITAQDLDEQSEFEIAMMIMSQINREIGVIERVEDRAVNMWPVGEF